MSEPAGLLARATGFLRSRSTSGALARRSLASFLINVAGTGIAFLGQLALGRWLGPAAYGTYAVHLGWVNVAVLLAKFNLDVAATRFVGSYVQVGDWGRLRGFVRRTAQFVIGAGLLLALAGLGLAFTRPPGPERTAIILASLLVPGTALLSLTMTTLQGLRRVVAAQGPNQVIRPLVLVAVAGIALFGFGASRSAVTGLAANLTAATVTVLLSWVLVQRSLPEGARVATLQYETRHWVEVAGWFLLSDIFQLVVSQQSDVLVVGAFLSVRDAGVYAAASQLSALVVFGTTAVQFAVSPVVAGLHAAGDHSAMRRALRGLATVNLLVSLPLALGLALIGRFALGLFGAEYTAGYPVLLALIATQCVVGGMGGAAATALSMTGHQRSQTWIVGISAAMYLALALVLTPRLGSLGTALATLGAASLRTAMYHWRARAILGMWLVPSPSSLMDQAPGDAPTVEPRKR